MGYSAGILNRRIGLYTRGDASSSDYGRIGGTYSFTRYIWAAIDFSRGVKSLREGALDAYDTIMIRCNYAYDITRESRFDVDGTIYQISSFHADKLANTIQITAIELQS